jgi:hypothetical protein
MRFEALAMHQTYVVQMDQGKGSHQELIASLSQNIVAYNPNVDGGSHSGPIEIAIESNDASREAESHSPHTNWRPNAMKASIDAVEEEKPPEPPAPRPVAAWSPSCCRRRSAKVAIQSPLPTKADVVIDVAPKGDLFGDAIVPAPAERSEPSLVSASKSGRDLPRINIDPRLSGGRLSDDKTSRVSEDRESRRSKNSKTSKTTQRTSDSKKYIETYSWMFRDETDGFAIRLPEGVIDKTLTINLSEIAEGMSGTRTGPFADGEMPGSGQGGSGGSRVNIPGPLQQSRIDGQSEASMSRLGSETTCSRTAPSTAATHLMTNQGLKDLFRMIWSARGFRRKYSRECHF